MEKTLEIVRATLSSILVEGIVDKIMEGIEKRIDEESSNDSALEIREIEDLREPRSYVEKGCRGPVYREAKADGAIADARAEAKGIDPLDREQLRTVLDQGGYIKADPSLRRYTLYESDGDPVCLISEDTWNNLVLEGEIMAITKHRNTPSEETTWVAA